MTKKKYHSSVLMIVTALALLLALATTFAWFSSRFVTKDFTFTTAKLGSSVTIFLGNDFDHDGYLDLGEVDGKIEEKYTIIESEMSEDGNTITIIEISDILPSEIYTFKFNVFNSGDVAGDVLAIFSNTDESNMLFLKTLAVTPVIIHDDNTMTVGEKIYFADTATDSELSVDVVRTPSKEDRYAALSGVSKYSKVDSLHSQTFVFRLEMVPYDELVKNVNGFADIMDKTQYNALQNANDTPYSLVFSVILEAEDFQYDAAQDNTPAESTSSSETGQN